MKRFQGLLLAVMLTAGCSSSSAKPHATPTPSPTTPSATPTPSASPSPKPVLHPFTGKPMDKARPVIAVKVDNAVLARPQWGLDLADVVYEEAVEGRTTRFIAIFSSQDAPDIGPVRSVRESDVELLTMYGKVAFAFSGGNRGVLAGVRNSGAVYEVSRNNLPGAYETRGRRRDAYNFVTSSAKILQYAPRAALAKDIGFRFGAPSKGGKSGKQMSFTWSGNARTSWVWSPAKKAYLRYMDGRPAMLRNGKQQSAPTVILQYCRVRNSRYSDVSGAPSPYTTTIGTGSVVVLRDGKAFTGTWKRTGNGPTRFVGADGKDIKLKAGPVWVMLAPRDLRATIK